MPQVSVESLGGDMFRVTVEDGRGRTVHQVAADSFEIERLGAGAPAEDVIDASFRFLLDREPKESIVRRFDLKVISGYFPEYDEKIADYL